MREYELFYLVGESKEAELDSIRTEIEKVCREEGAEFLPPETSDKRKLAYEVEDETRGIYIARRFTLPDKSELAHAEYEVAVAKGDTITRLNRKFALMKNVLRVLVLRAENLPELKAIERTEYAKKEVRGRGVRRERPVSSSSTPAGTATPAPAAPVVEAKQVTKEEMDAQLKAKLDI